MHIEPPLKQVAIAAAIVTVILCICALITSPVPMMVPVIILGLVSIFILVQARGISEDYVNDAKYERQQDAVRKELFFWHFPYVNSKPLIGIFCTWLYAQTWIYCGLLFIITLIGFWLRLKGLGAMEFIEDEYPVISAAYGYLNSGTFYQWDFLTDSLSTSLYERAWPHSLMIAVSFKLFGFSEWSARIPSLIFGTILIPLSYFIGKHATDRKVIGLMLAVLVSFSPRMVFLSQYARMYVVFLPVFLLGGYLLYRGLEGRCPWKFDKWPSLHWIVGLFDFDYRYLIAAGIVLTFSYLLHINTLIIGPGVFLFTIIMALYSKEIRYKYLSGFLSLMLIVVIIGNYLGITLIHQIFHYISISASQKFLYIIALIEYPFGIYISALLLAATAIIICKNRRLLFYFCLTFSALVYFVLFSNRYYSFMYISNYSVWAWLLLLPGLALISFYIFNKKKNVWRIVFSIITLLAVIVSIAGQSGIPIHDYRPEYRMVWDGNQWFGETIHSSVSVSGKNSLDADVVSHTIPVVMDPGKNYTVSITVQNTGSMPWSEGGCIRLGGVGDKSGGAWVFGPDRINIVDKIMVDPGQCYTFNYTLVAPLDPGIYTIQYRMVWDGHEWFGETLHGVITVSGQKSVGEIATNSSTRDEYTVNAEVVSDTMPALMTSGQSYNASITVRNTGLKTWSETDGISLGGIGDWGGDAAMFGPNRVKIHDGTTVTPGQNYTFTFTMTAPKAYGTYTPQYQMVWEGQEWFGQTLNQTVFVARGDVVNAEVVNNTLPATMTRGQSYSVSVTMKNTGLKTWSEADGIRLGGVGDKVGDAATFGPDRIEIQEGTTVEPGQSYTFTFTMTAPSIMNVYDAGDSFGQFRKGYKELNEEYREGDLLIAQYLRDVYITIPGNVSFESLESKQAYTYEEFLNKTAQYDRIWVTWESRKSYHIQPEIIQYIDSHFQKIHGEGIDDTHVELYFWDKTDINSSEDFK